MIEDYPRTLMELEQRFGDEAKCRDYLFALRWSQGFICPVCGAGGLAIRRDLWRCVRCGLETSVVAGTIFQDSKLPLVVWFRAMWQVASQKNGLSALGLQRVLGLGNYKTAWALLHKLRRVMVRPGRDRLSGVVEVDEAYWGAEESGVRGRRSVSKALIIVAAQADAKGIGRIRLQHIPDTITSSIRFAPTSQAVVVGGVTYIALSRIDPSSDARGPRSVLLNTSHAFGPPHPPSPRLTPLATRPPRMG